MRALLAAACALLFGALPPPAADAETIVRHATVNVDGVEIFYRETGPADAPVVLLLHGFPSSSFMFRELLPKLADRWRVVAPDYPGFGASAFPSRERYAYSFANLARSIERFTEVLRLERYAIYIQDYGAPIGLRLALRRPERITALVVQNGNAYAEGLSAAWDPLKAYWSAPTDQTREQLRGWLTENGIREQYVAGVPAELLERFSPDTWTLDWVRLNRHGNIDVQLHLFGDYRTNVELYPSFQALIRERQWPTLVVWGRYDPFFTEEGAAAYRRDVPAAEIHLLGTGHFALETHAPEIAALMREFLERHQIGRSVPSVADSN
jgi:pimeloyl-ACP methyl ester carboxylesterase